MNKKQLISGLMAGALTLALAAPMAAPAQAAGLPPSWTSRTATPPSTPTFCA